MPARFFAEMRAKLDPVEARVWIAHARLEQVEGEWVFTTTTSFKAHWIRTRFSHAVERAARAVEMARRPEVRARVVRP